jgi:hypothetical protein
MIPPHETRSGFTWFTREYLVEVPDQLEVFDLFFIARGFEARVEIVTDTDIIALPKKGEDLSFFLLTLADAHNAFEPGGRFAVRCSGQDSQQALVAIDSSIADWQRRVRFPPRETGVETPEDKRRDTLVILTFSDGATRRFSKVLVGGPSRTPWRVCGVVFLLDEEDKVGSPFHSGYLPLGERIVSRVSKGIEAYRPSLVVVHMGEAFLIDPNGFRWAFIRLRYRYPDVAFVLEDPAAKTADMSTFRQPDEIQLATELLR